MTGNEILNEVFIQQQTFLGRFYHHSVYCSSLPVISSGTDPDPFLRRGCGLMGREIMDSDLSFYTACFPAVFQTPGSAERIHLQPEVWQQPENILSFCPGFCRFSVLYRAHDNRCGIECNMQ